MANSAKHPFRLPVILILLAGAGAGAWAWRNAVTHAAAESKPQSIADTEFTSSQDTPRAVLVQTVHPSIGKSERVVTQPGSVLAYQVVQLYAKASGFLKTQNVDIGSKVKKGEVLAIVDVPELAQMLAKAKAVLAQSEARVEQMKSRDKSAVAEHEAALAGISQAEANEKSASAMLRYRTRQHARLKELFDSRSIDERLVDESKQQLEAAAEAERSATANIATTKAHASAKQAKILESHADILEAKAGVEVARSEAQRLQVQVDFATISAPFDGVVTARHMFPGDYVRAANESGSQPLFVIQRVDRMRVVVQIPDRDVPYADVGDPAVVELDALPARSFPAKVSRLAESEDPQTRLMSLEIDVANPEGVIRQGMFGRVRIVLDPQASILSIPSASLVGRSQGGKATAYIVRDGKAKLATLRVGYDDGVNISVLEGITVRDEVVVRPSSDLYEGVEVETRPHETSKSARK